MPDLFDNINDWLLNEAPGDDDVSVILHGSAERLHVGVSHAVSAEIADELPILIYGLRVNLANKTVDAPEKARAILYRSAKMRVPQLRSRAHCETV